MVHAPNPFSFAAAVLLAVSATASLPAQVTPAPETPTLLTTETLDGEGVWQMPVLRRRVGARTRVTLWFADQLLGDGEAYRRRSKEWAGQRRRTLRAAAIATLKHLSARSQAATRSALDGLVKAGQVSDPEYHWIVNCLTCTVRGKAGLDAVAKLPGVRKIFLARMTRSRPATTKPGFAPPPEAGTTTVAFDPKRFRHPWYTSSLLADRVWTEFGITGAGTLNVIHDGNFILAGNGTANVYRNPKEIPGNGKDDDGNGLVDDYHGFNFVTRSPQLTVVPGDTQLHGTLCAAVVCGQGSTTTPYETGIAPSGSWAGVIAGPYIEAAVQWAIEQGADTYSMSFSMGNLGAARSHWRKVMEHGALCGVCFASGAGNSALRNAPTYSPVPTQMRTPEDIPDVVFAGAGVQRDLSRTAFSSQGPVEWSLEHYREGRVAKPEVCAFNDNLPSVHPDGQVFETGISGNSFAGPMVCGTIALMLSADPDLLPWDLREILTSTALDVGPEGVDSQTGHGLINCYRAVKEVLRRRAVRDGADPSPFTGRVAGDVLDVAALRKALKDRRPQVLRVKPGSPAAAAGIRVGDLPKSFDGQPVATGQQFLDRMRAAFRAGRTVPVVFTRDGKDVAIPIHRGLRGFRVGDGYLAPVFR